MARKGNRKAEKAEEREGTGGGREIGKTNPLLVTPSNTPNKFRRPTKPLDSRFQSPDE